MKEYNLLASIALFKTLYDNDKDIYDVLSDFIKAAIYFSKKWQFTSTDINILLDDIFEFKIPEAVVKTTLRKRLKKSGHLSLNNGLYTVVSEELRNDNKIYEAFHKKRESQNQIIGKLIEYIDKIENKILGDAEKELIKNNFCSYLMDNSYIGKYSDNISAFILQHQNDSKFKNELNSIKEGVILYSGIQYSSDLNTLGGWNTELAIYLDTEHLFNALGYNGIIYKDIFNDFYKLVSEINRNSLRKQGKKLIQLKYFEENKEEIDNFFYVAELIIEGKKTLNPSKIAMQAVLDGCVTKSDVIAKKAKFYQALKSKGIVEERKKEFYSDKELNIEDKEIIKELTELFKERNKEFDENEFYHFLKLFTKINVFRKGKNNVGFERIGYIFLTGNNLALFISHHKSVKNRESDIPFATDIDFVTNKFWFKLNKGFSSKKSLPKSFDIITKAQIVLSSQINNIVADEYGMLKNKFKNGEITEEEAIAYNYELKRKSKRPEEIIPELIDESVLFLNSENYIEDYLREQSILRKRAEDGEKAIKKLEKIKNNEILSNKKKIKSKIKSYYLIYLFFPLLFFSVILTLSIYFFLKNIVNPNDTPLSIISFIIGLLSLILPILYYLPKNTRKLKVKMKKRYIKELKELLNNFQ